MPTLDANGNRSRAYVAWWNMRRRCNDARTKQTQDYRGRGIYHAPRWCSFAVFLADMGEPSAGLTLERVDNDGPYYPGNCRWATRAEQNLNKRNVSRYEHAGENLTLREWGERVGVQRLTLRYRLTHGWTLARALSTPVRLS